MRVLALDSTSRAGSVALIVDAPDGQAVDERAGDPARTHAERLPSDLLALLASHELTACAVDLFVVASGPGLFTGLRIGIATMQGFALACGTPIVAVPALDALGHLASRDQPPGATVAAWMNAHRRDVFTALFRVGRGPMFDPARLTTREGPSVGDPHTTLRRWMDDGAAPSVVAGDGAELYRSAVTDRFPAAAIIDPSPLAAAIGLIGLELHRRGERGRAAGVQPLYVRRPDAELAREHALADRSAHVDRSD